MAIHAQPTGVRPASRSRLARTGRIEIASLRQVGAFLLGLIVSPLVMVTLATGLTWLYHGLDGPGEYGVAVDGTRRLASALDRYRGRYQHVPTAKEGLAKLAPEFVPFVPNDPWGHPYLYDTTGPDWADVLSYGSDGHAGGSGDAADMSARFGRLGSRPPGWVHSLATVVLVGIALAMAALAGDRPWCGAVLAGISAFWGVLLLATLSGTVWGSLLTPLSFITGLACLTASVALLDELIYARLFGLLSVVSAYALLQNFLSG